MDKPLLQKGKFFRLYIAVALGIACRRKEPHPMPKLRHRDPAIDRIRITTGLADRIAERLGISKQAVRQWEEVPPLRVLIVAEMIGMTPHVVRPDIYPNPEDGL